MRKFLNWFVNHLFGHLITLPVVSFCLFLVAKIPEWLEIIDKPRLISYIESHPIRVVFTVLLLSFIILFIGRGYRFLITAIRNREILLTVGVSGFWNHSNDVQKKENWEFCQQRILSNETRQLRILGATGWDTFGKREAPLHDLVENFTGEIKILLLKPESKAASARARSVGVSPDDYNKEINDTIYFCNQLKARGRPITVKFYDQSPIWKMIFTEKYMWLQYYKQDKHVDETPVYMLFANDSKTSLYFPLLNVFVKKWDYDNNKTVVEPGNS